MAEAAVEERPTQRFYCHMCNVRFERASSSFTCPHCANGFIEELLDQPEEIDESFFDPWEDSVTTMRNIVDHGIPLSNDRTNARSMSLDGGRGSQRRPGRRGLTRISPSLLRSNMPIETFLQDVIINLGVGINLSNTANMQLILGNPGDYAWGREGLDAIITQLLNQMDSTGPPPVSKDVIDALPIVSITEEQVDKKLQCSVCWEDFKLKEEVRQLPCQHVYHEMCIRPWLGLHGTCPICRQNLSNDNQSDNQDSGGPSGGGGRNQYHILSNVHNSSQLFDNTLNSSGSSSSSDTSNSVIM